MPSMPTSSSTSHAFREETFVNKIFIIHKNHETFLDHENLEPYSICNTDTLQKCSHYQDVLIFQVSLYVLKGCVGTITKCVDHTNL